MGGLRYGLFGLACGLGIGGGFLEGLEGFLDFLSAGFEEIRREVGFVEVEVEDGAVFEGEGDVADDGIAARGAGEAGVTDASSSPK